MADCVAAQRGHEESGLHLKGGMIRALMVKQGFLERIYFQGEDEQHVFLKK